MLSSETTKGKLAITSSKYIFEKIRAKRWVIKSTIKLQPTYKQRWVFFFFFLPSPGLPLWSHIQVLIRTNDLNFQDLTRLD